MDCHEKFQADCYDTEYGGHLSVRKPIGKKPVMILGQDESIFKQYSFTPCTWTLPNGKKPLIPKDDGKGVMISAFCSRELGYGPMFLSQPQLDKVNNMKRGKTKIYSDINAAIAINGSSSKPLLTESPFVIELEYGANAEGYWTYDRMVLQMEDCIDCLSVLYPSFDIVLLFDHSNGHDRMQPDGLSVSKIGIKYGGKQPHMRNSKLTDPHLFGPYHTKDFKLQPGDTQSMSFSSDADNIDGPCSYSLPKREAKRHDKTSGKTQHKDILKIDLIQALKNEGVRDPKGTKKQLQKLCTERNLPTRYTTQSVTEGWLGKQKGSFQILYERGWLDPDHLSMYTEKGKEDEMGLLREDTSIKVLLQKQQDFFTELTLLQ